MKIKKKIGYLFLCFFVLLLGLYFCRNLIFSSLFESGTESIFGAKAEVKKCNLQIFSGKLSWEDFTVADKSNPMKNLFQTGYVELDFALFSLFKGQLVCENVLVEKLEFGTERATDGSLSKKEDKDEKSVFAKYATNYLEEKKSSIPILEYQNLNVDSILNATNFITPMKADSLRQEIKKANEFWSKILNDKKYKQRVEEIVIKFDDLDLSNPAKAGKEISKLSEESRSLYKEIKKDKADFKQQYELLKSANKLQRWAKQDYDNAMKMVKFPDVQGKKIGESLFGGFVYELVLKALTAIKSVRLASSADEPKKEQKLRFWLKEMQINSKLDNGILITGVVENISNAQKLTGEPIIINLSLSSDKIKSVKVAGEFNYLSDNSRESFFIETEGVTIDNIKLNQEVLPPKINSCFLNGETTLEILDDDFTVNSFTTINDIQFSYDYEKEVSSQMREVARIVGKSTDSVWIKVNCEFSSVQNVSKINSNLDDIVRKALYKKFSNESKKIKEKIQKKIGLQKEQKELNSLFENLDGNVQSILSISEPISAKQKKKKEKEIGDNLLKKGKEVINNTEIKNKAEELIKGIKF